MVDSFNFDGWKKKKILKNKAIFIQLLGDHLQEAGHSGRKLASGRSLWMIIYNPEKGMKNAFLRPFTIK